MLKNKNFARLLKVETTPCIHPIHCAVCWIDIVNAVKMRANLETVKTIANKRHSRNLYWVTSFKHRITSDWVLRFQSLTDLTTYLILLHLYWVRNSAVGEGPGCLLHTKSSPLVPVLPSTTCPARIPSGWTISWRIAKRWVLHWLPTGGHCIGPVASTTPRRKSIAHLAKRFINTVVYPFITEPKIWINHSSESLWKRFEMFK